MTRLPKAITFDCYGTLIDWESEIQHFFAQHLEAKHIGHVDPTRCATSWGELREELR